MTKTPDEIKTGLECCSISYADCNNECPYKRDCDGSQILKDALALIQQLEADKVRLLEESHEIRRNMFEHIKQLEAERDALLEYLTNAHWLACSICKHDTEDGVVGCKHIRENGVPCFEWRGLQKEE